MTTLKTQLIEHVDAIINDLTGKQSTNTDLVNTLTQYFNLCDRIPSIRKWQIFESNHFDNQSFNEPIRQGIQNFIAAAKAGEDLRPWLHDAVFNNKQDALMNDWGIQHYHLGVSLEEKNGRKRIERSNELLYAIHKEETGCLYLIAVFDHGSFSEKKLLEIVKEEWPELMQHGKIKNMTDISYSPTGNEIHLLRKKQVNSAVEIDGEYFFGPGGGFMCSGHSAAAVMKSIAVKKLLNRLQKEVDDEKLLVYFETRNRSIFLVDDTNQRCCRIL